MHDKIKTLGQLGQIASDARTKGQKVVLAHGVFDILHVGHKRHLDIGKHHGDVLIVTLTTDKFANKCTCVEPRGKPAKENIIATKYRDREIFCGGAVATANLAAQLCGHVDLVTLLGQEESHEDFVRRNLHPNIGLVPFYRQGGRTTVKSRLVDPAYVKKLIEVAYLSDEALPDHEQAALNDWVDDKIAQYDAVIVNDFGHGMIDSRLIDIVCRKAKFLAVNAQTNSANRGFNLITKYPRADLICIDEPEARLAAMERYAPIEAVVRDQLEKRIDCHVFIITHGKLGSIVYTPKGGVKRIPALIGEAIDTIGAGDAFFALAAPLVAKGSDPFLAAFIGHAVGAMKVRIVGQRHQITQPEIFK